MKAGWHCRWIVPMLMLGGLLCLPPMASPVTARPVKDKSADTHRQSEKSALSDKENSPRSVKARSQKPTESKPAIEKETGQKHGADRRGHKARRQVPKKLVPQATVEPKPDLSYMGKFQAPQRYNPSRDAGRGGPPNPQTGDVLHEHFQELDRNHDGVIDPLERASGRLDIDRDLTGRQWQ